MSDTNKKIFDSPTTPGIKIDFRNYLVELICLNVNKNIGPRFWRDKKYWSQKYVREIKGVYNLSQSLGGFDDQFISKAIIHVIKKHNIKSLLKKITIQKLAKYIPKLAAKIKKQYKTLAVSQETREIVGPNFSFRKSDSKGRLSKVKDAENDKKECD